ncbi:hypothetical protein Pint_20862 [Pistacia integerrima]|uniref:Uncharacterized protein n=1 Tax=Pistacia integerrima TaxID=434235 RepID=A0ACC0X8J6_9ROSI|nr:hypothetical protein Pint_20862 [Pistacia integerrima]
MEGGRAWSCDEIGKTEKADGRDRIDEWPCEHELATDRASSSRFSGSCESIKYILVVLIRPERFYYEFEFEQAPVLFVYENSQRYLMNANEFFKELGMLDRVNLVCVHYYARNSKIRIDRRDPKSCLYLSFGIHMSSPKLEQLCFHSLHFFDPWVVLKAILASSLTGSFATRLCCLVIGNVPTSITGALALQDLLGYSIPGYALIALASAISRLRISLRITLRNSLSNYWGNSTLCKLDVSTLDWD